MVLLTLAAAMVIFGAYSHRILPASMDECQQDVSHGDHVSELPAFHCIGHSEWNLESNTWDHVHPWMTEEWRREHEIDGSSADSD